MAERSIKKLNTKSSPGSGSETNWRSKIRSRCFAFGIVKQMGAILAMGCILGLAYNAANPIGIRWSESKVAQPPPKPAPASPVAFLASTSSITIVTTATGAVAQTTNQAGNQTTNATTYVPPSPTTWAEIKPLHLKKKCVLVDARSAPYFEAGHIPGAVNLPEPPDPQPWEAFIKQHAKSEHLVAYCSSTNCSLSFKLATRLAKDGGYEFVQFMTGGYQAWLREESLAKTDPATVVSNSPPPQVTPREMPAQEVAPILPPVAGEMTGKKLENALPTTWMQTRPLLGLGQSILVDSRPQAEFDLGHIPGAVSVPFDAPVPAIRQMLADKGSSTRIVVYCGSMGCPEAFQLATRLVRDLDYANAQFMLEGYAEWRQLDQKAVKVPVPNGGGR